MIVTASISDQPGTHCLLFAQARGEIFFADPPDKKKDYMIIRTCTRICDQQFTREISY